jgi:hypothetical protein
MPKKWIILFLFGLSVKSEAFKSGGIGVGLNQMYVGMLNKVSSQSSGKNDFLGTYHMFPLTVNYQKPFLQNWFFVPSFTYSILPRKSEGGSIEENLMLVGFPMGQNYSQNLDWFVGPGIYRSTLTAKGGDYTDGSGNTFYYPTGAKSAQLIYVSAGFGWTASDYRFAFETLCLTCASSDKRTLIFSFLFSYQGWGY